MENKPMNKGLEIRDKKLAKRKRQAHSMKEGQEEVCRFVTASYAVYKKVKGKVRHAGQKKIRGLQVKNKLYLSDGKYKLINAKGLHKVREVEGIPEWANDFLKEKYNEFYQLNEK